MFRRAEDTTALSGELRRNRLTGKTVSPQNPGPVSYTHLDVYKRQA
ncbi:hypothetical protein [Burkholderia plantarii]|nr:hypothetical protein [Burkholderia plantarii]